MIKILEQHGMLQRLTPKSKPAIFQLYPKPYSRPVSRSPHTPAPTPMSELQFDGEGYFDDTHYYSRNRRYRCEREAGDTLGIERRVQDGWKLVTDFHRSQEMNPDIIDYFQRCLEAKREVENALSRGRL